MARKLSLLLLIVCMACASQQKAASVRTSEQMVKEAKAAIEEVSVEAVKKMIDSGEKIVLLDVRDRDEFESGHIPGAINLSRGMLEFKVHLVIPDRTARIIVYCGVDLRGPLATKTLNELGYRNAANIAGGMKLWKEAGYPLVK